MTLVARSGGEPVGSVRFPAGFDHSGALTAALALARATAGPGMEALILAGSHSSGEAVWATLGSRALSLSDLDVYAVLPDDAACRAASARFSAEQPAVSAALSELGFLAPLEMGFLTRRGLSAMPAKPGVLELRRHGRVVAGDPHALASVPDWSARDVTEEERRLLLENRGFELLLAAPDPLVAHSERLQARHAALKAALDLAGVLALSEGEWPDGAEARVNWARQHVVPAMRAQLPEGHEDAPGVLEALWETALAFRAEPTVLDGEATHREWQQIVRMWCAVWALPLHLRANDPWPTVLREAARAPWRRRIRQALLFQSRTGVGPDLSARWRHLAAGTPQHRVHGSAVVLLHVAAQSARVPVFAGGALRALSRLGVTRQTDWEGARREVIRAWDQWLQLGQRTPESA